MAQLNKTANGLLFFDDFKEQTLMWTLSPSDANNLRFTEDGLTMLHNRRYTTYTIVEPAAEEYSCIVELDHIPFNFDDIGGVIVIENNKEYAECQSFMATAPSELGNANLVQADIRGIIKELMGDNYVTYTVDFQAPSVENSVEDVEKSTDIDSSEHVDTDTEYVDTLYRYIKFHKMKYKYVFYASADGINWIEVGNVKFASSGVIGFFLYGTTDQDIIDHSHFNIKSFTLYEGKYLTVDGINRAYEIEIYDGDGNILLRTDNNAYLHLFSRSNTRLLVNTTTLPIPLRNATLRIFPKYDYDNTIGRYDLGPEVYGGDGFSLEHNVKIFINNEFISPYTLYDLGTFFHNSYHIEAAIQNCEDYALKDLKIRVIKYSEYYGGEEEVMVALQDDNLIGNELDYAKEIVIDNLNPTDSKKFNIKLDDKVLQGAYKPANLYRFKIVIE